MRLHVVSCQGLSVCPSICLSVKRVDYQKRKETCARMKDHLYYFSEKKNGWWGATPSIWHFASNWPCRSGNADFQSIFVRSAWAVVPSEKSSINNTNRTFTTRFPMSLRWTLYVAPKPPIWGSKTQNGRFPVQKLQFTWRKSAIKFLCLIYYQQQSCKTFTGLSISAEWFAEVRPMLRANLADTDQSSLITPISNQYSPVAPQP